MDSDSDFYGDEETVSHLKSRVAAFDVHSEVQDLSFNLLSHQPKQGKPTTAIGHLHNPYEGVAYAWQLSETVDAFLARLPPSTTSVKPGHDWIYICNPFISLRPKLTAPNQHVRGCEDEAPLDFDTNLDLFIEGGMERLHMLSEFITKTTKASRTKAIATREINKERGLAVTQILDLAHHLHVRCGKWMFFPEPSYVDDVWEVIARATAANELGVAAKVAPMPPDYEGRAASARLVCVYTRDFRDKDDIARVLNRLRELELVKRQGKPIYYKCDAYTYLGIGSKNAWDIRASLYSSIDIFNYIKTRDEA